MNTTAKVVIAVFVVLIVAGGGYFGYTYIQNNSIGGTATHQVSFTEAGLSSGTSWSLTIAGTTESSSTNTITFSEVNGNYNYAVSNVPGYSASDGAGSFTVSGQSISESITFSTNTVTVTGVNVQFVYNGTTSGYFGPTSQTGPGFNGNVFQQFTYILTLTSSALLFSHSINAIAITTSDVNISSFSPTLPYSVSPGATVDININFNMPLYSYTGVLDIVVYTT